MAANPSVVGEAQEFKDFGLYAVSFQLDLSTTEGVEQLYSRIIATGRDNEEGKDELTESLQEQARDRE